MRLRYECQILKYKTKKFEGKSSILKLDFFAFGKFMNRNETEARFVKASNKILFTAKKYKK